MPRSPILACVALAAVLAAAAGEPPPVAPPKDPAAGGSENRIDREIRRVNLTTITFVEVFVRAIERQRDLEERGRPLPARSDMPRFLLECLEELTDEELIIQKATELGIKPDTERIKREVLEDAKRIGRGIDQRSLVLERKKRERTTTINYVLGWFDQRTSLVTPEAMTEEYRRSSDEFKRPARAHVLQICVAPAGAAERTAIARDQADLLKRAQRAGAGPAVKALADACLAEYLEAPPARQAELLDRLTAGLAELSGREGLVADDAALATSARKLREAAANLRDEAQSRTALEALRQRLAGLEVTAREAEFRAAAKAMSSGPNAAEGGDLGATVEPGTYSAEFDAQAFTLPVGQVSPVFTARGLLCLILVRERRDARVLSFDEVSGGLDRVMTQARRDALRTAIIRVLRSRAQISDLDLASLRELPR